MDVRIKGGGSISGVSRSYATGSCLPVGVEQPRTERRGGAFYSVLGCGLFLIVLLGGLAWRRVRVKREKEVSACVCAGG